MDSTHKAMWRFYNKGHAPKTNDQKGCLTICIVSFWGRVLSISSDSNAGQNAEVFIIVQIVILLMASNSDTYELPAMDPDATRPTHFCQANPKLILCRRRLLSSPCLCHSWSMCNPCVTYMFILRCWLDLCEPWNSQAPNTSFFKFEVRKIDP